VQSWVVEGPLDGSSWTELDRETDTQSFNTWNRWFNQASFSVSKGAKCRFIRLAQTGWLGRSFFDDY
jgi:hypothetical protein